MQLAKMQLDLHLCSEDKRKSYEFGTTWGWVINGRIYIFWVNYPFECFNIFGPL